MPNFIVGPKPKIEYEQFTCRFEKQLLDKARKLARENQVPSVNEFMNQCIRFAIANLREMKESED